MERDPLKFFEELNKLLKGQIDKRFQHAPSKEQIEFHLENCELWRKALGASIAQFLYDLSWLEELLEKHGGLFSDDMKKQIAYLQRQANEYAKSLESQ